MVGWTNCTRSGPGAASKSEAFRKSPPQPSRCCYNEWRGDRWDRLICGDGIFCPV